MEHKHANQRCAIYSAPLFQTGSWKIRVCWSVALPAVPESFSECRPGGYRSYGGADSGAVFRNTRRSDWLAGWAQDFCSEHERSSFTKRSRYVYNQFAVNW